MSEKRKSTTDFEENGAARIDEKKSRLNTAVFFLINATLVFSAVAFGAVDTWALAVLSLLAGLIVALWLADAFFKREFEFGSSKLQIPLFGLIAVGLIQLLPFRASAFSAELLSIPAANSLSLAPYSTRNAIIQLVVYAIFFAAALLFVNSYKRLQKIVVVVIVFSSLMAFYGILQRLANLETIYGLRHFNQAIPFASFVNQHHFAAFMEMIVGLTLGLLFGRATKNDKRIFLIIAVLIMGIAIVFTGSRGGIMSLVGVIGFVVTANLLQKPQNETSERDGQEISDETYLRKFALIGGSLTLLLILFGTVLLLGGDESLLRGIGLTNSEDISNGRLHFWQIAWRVFLDYPVIGTGLDAFGTMFPRYDSWNGAFRVEQAHNDYLQILADAGIFGLACIAAYIFLLFKQGISLVGKTKDKFRRGAATGALAGSFGVLIHSFFDFPLRTPSNAFFFLILSVIAVAPIVVPKRPRRRHARQTIEQP